MAFIADLKNIMFVNATPVQQGKFKLYTFVEMEKFNKITILGSTDLPAFEPKTMVDVRFSVSQAPAQMVRNGETKSVTETKAFLIHMQPVSK